MFYTKQAIARASEPQAGSSRSAAQHVFPSVPVLREQLDLRNEARNLDRFNANFRRWPECWFPEPLKPLVTEDVLVETFEYGESVLRYVDGTARALIKDDPSATPLR